jgi:hypothetical protein
MALYLLLPDLCFWLQLKLLLQTGSNIKQAITQMVPNQWILWKIHSRQ